MAKKRKHAEASTEQPKKEEEEEVNASRPKRTLLGFKDELVVEKKSDAGPVFQNKEKVLVTWRIIYRYQHLMLNVVSLLTHCKKDSKVESKASKGATLNELVELRNFSYCLFF